MTREEKQAVLIAHLIRRLLEAQQKNRDNQKLINRLLELVEKWEPAECPDCDEETLVINMLSDGQTTGPMRVCYNCGYEREEG